MDNETITYYKIMSLALTPNDYFAFHFLTSNETLMSVPVSTKTTVHVHSHFFFPVVFSAVIWDTMPCLASDEQLRGYIFKKHL